MQTEYELRILNIDKDAVIKKLESLGARKVHDEVVQQRYIMDFPDNRLWKSDGWVRVRKVGDERVELTYKNRTHPHTVDSTHEVCFEVSNADEALDFLKEIGLEVKRFQENKRIKYRKNNVFYDIDTWPGKQPYVEIESDNEQDVWKAVAMLGFKKEDCIFTAGPELLELLGFHGKEQELIRF